MTKTEAKPAIVAVNELFAKSPDGLREIVRAAMQEMLEAERRTGPRRASDRHPARLPLRLLHPHPRDPRRQARTAGAPGSRRPVLDRTLRALPALRQALVATPAEMYVHGVSTRKIKAITEELYGHAFSASAETGRGARRSIDPPMALREAPGSDRDAVDPLGRRAAPSETLGHGVWS